ncbi:MAG: protein translocase subunit SecF [bacterium]|nr:protein translocase subunit SecF [bacterium]MDD3804739.1 protein translocase subunit SecF [bacterium]MDD4152377.1 protein translocase subunit SecF [bacterium]
MSAMRYQFDFVRSRKIWYTISAVLILAGFIAMVMNYINPQIKAPLKLGIDFTGGTEVRVKMPVQFTVDDVASKLSSLSLPRESLKRSQNELIITTQQKSGEEFSRSIVDILSKDYGVKPQDVNVDMVGPSIGKELQVNALIALCIGLFGILLFVTIRYDFKYAISAIAGLLHDVLILLGFFAITRIDINSFLVPCILTVVGYSINDTIVIFDRLRENTRLDKKSDFRQLVNSSINQTLTRSVFTVLTTELTIMALFLFGGATIHTFALALFVGITTGCYSSIFISSQLLVSMRLKEDGKRKGKPARLETDYNNDAAAVTCSVKEPAELASAGISAAVTKRRSKKKRR